MPNNSGGFGTILIFIILIFLFAFGSCNGGKYENQTLDKTTKILSEIATEFTVKIGSPEIVIENNPIINVDTSGFTRSVDEVNQRLDEVQASQARLEENQRLLGLCTVALTGELTGGGDIEKLIQDIMVFLTDAQPRLNVAEACQALRDGVEGE